MINCSVCGFPIAGGMCVHTALNLTPEEWAEKVSKSKKGYFETMKTLAGLFCLALLMIFALGVLCGSLEYNWDLQFVFLCFCRPDRNKLYGWIKRWKQAFEFPADFGKVTVLFDVPTVPPLDPFLLKELPSDAEVDDGKTCGCGMRFPPDGYCGLCGKSK
ncbi:MAG: hypothetical protein CVU44_11235 [Chloroflexi bacterium HGW-Chloroflexi-6]|nr:MAG: hypothetical protein CVU44_11235 [Chloroflexi bacterium HGW-Chloroflexi-6]